MAKDAYNGKTWPLAYLGVSGIYAITCIETGKVYIGSSVFIGSRIATHYRALSLGQHPIKELQSDYNKLGVDAFHVYVVETCDEEHLLTVERRVMRNRLGSGTKLYNKQLPRRGRAEEQNTLFNRLKTENLSYQELADSLGVSKGTLWGFLNHGVEPKREDLRQSLGLDTNGEWIVSVRFVQRDALGRFT